MKLKRRAMRIPGRGRGVPGSGTEGTMALRQQSAGELYALVKSPPLHIIATIYVYIILHYNL